MKGGDITAPKGAPYPGTAESPELRSALIRKIYVVLCLQFLLTAVVAAVVVKVPAIPHFFLSTHAGLGLYMFILIFPFIDNHVVRHLGVVPILRGHDFSFLGPFLFASLIVLLVFGFIQILFPLDELSLMIFGVLAALIFSGLIVYDTDNIIKRCAGGIHLLWFETRTTSSSVTYDD
uniref:Uncharacterized protein n=1 Tax=Triticum aestivum TaxID=4565 RepID=A0A077S693_WHEAT|nr:unnamed protein product [Triticum aestivum]